MHDQLPSPEQLEAFFEVARCLHFQEAADTLHLSQPALSRRIQSLEDVVGVRLFDRSTRDVVLTASGQVFLDASEPWRLAMREARRQAQAAELGLTGIVKVGVVGSAAISLIPRLIRKSMEANQGVRIEMMEMHESLQWDALGDGELDIICVRSAGRAGYQSKVLVKAEPVCFVAHVEHRLAGRKKVSVKEILNEDYILWPRNLDRQTGAREAALFAESGGGMRVIYEVPSVWSVLGLVAAGVGSSLLAQSYGQIRWPDVVFVPVVGYSLPFGIYWRSDNLNPAMYSFLQIAGGPTTTVAGDER